MNAAAFIDIMNRIDSLDVDAGARQQFKKMVREVGAERGYSLPDRRSRVLFARQLLDRRVSRSTIRDRLMAHFQISRTQAYRIIDQALQLSRLSSDFGTLNTFNDSAEHVAEAGSLRDDGDGRQESSSDIARNLSASLFEHD